MTERTLAVDGLMVRWEEGGDPAGIPTVLIHGLPTSPRLWRYVVPRLEGARVIAWELIGYGGSIPVGESHEMTLAAQAEYLAGMLRATGIDGAILAGHDVGGGVVQMMAVRKPELVRGIVLIDTVSLDSWPVGVVKMVRSLGPIFRHMPNALIKTMIKGMLRRGHADGTTAIESFWEHWPFYEKMDAGAAFVRQVQALNHEETLQLTAELSRLEIPSRLVWGASDPFQSLEYAHRLSTMLRAPLDAVDGAKHYIPEDNPDRAAAAINSLIRELSAPGARPSRKHATRSGAREVAQPESPRQEAPGATGPSRGAQSSSE